MAEIRVQPKPRSRLWLWLLLLVALVALAAWYLTSQGYVTVRETGLAPATLAAPAVLADASARVPDVSAARG